jgi:hypothetical protein
MSRGSDAWKCKVRAEISGPDGSKSMAGWRVRRMLVLDRERRADSPMDGLFW